MSDNIKYIFREKEYLSDDELEQLIAEVEAEPLLHPPREFQSEILQTIRQKRKRKKDAQLFFYSVKVIAASAAALLILITVPHDFHLQTNVMQEKNLQQDVEEQVRVEERNEKMSGIERVFEEEVTYKLNRKVNGYFGELNNKLNQLMKMEVIYNEKEEK